MVPGVGAFSTSEGWISCGWPINFGQMGYDPTYGGYDDVVYSAISLYAKTIAQLPGQHLELEASNEAKLITTSALSRVLKKPNPYSTRSTFLFNLVWSRLQEGNGYAVATRNARQEVVRLDLVNPYQTRPMVNRETGDVFYSVGGNPLLDPLLDDANPGTRWIIPGEDVLHVRAHTPVHPLIGESPLVAAGAAIAINSGSQEQFVTFTRNQARPSGVIYTDQKFNKAQRDELRDEWTKASNAAMAGGTPILTGGMKWQAAVINNTDAETSEFRKQAIASIARIYGVPLALLNVLDSATLNNTEQLMQMWLRQGLGFELDAIELAFDQLYELETTSQYTEFDIEALLRPDWKTRIDALARGVQGAIYSPNEARKKEGLKRVPDGDMPRVQQQLVSLDWTPPAPAAASPAADPKPDPKDDNEPGDAGNEPGADPKPGDDTSKAFADFLIERAYNAARKGTPT